MFRATLKSLLSRKLRLLLSAFAVLLGVMFVSGSLVMTESLGNSFDKLFANITSTVDVQVTAEPKVDTGADAAIAPIPAQAVEKVQAVSGVREATGGVWTEGARVIGKNGKVAASFAPRFGFGWTGTDDLLELREGRGPRAPNEIVIDASIASQLDYEVGDQIGVLTLQPKRQFAVVGIFGYSGGRDTLGGSQAVGFTMPTAQELMVGQKDVFTEISVLAQDGVSREQLRDDVAEALGDGYQVRTREEVAEAAASDIEEGLSFFNYLLLGFAGVALFVGIFLILNTFSMLVAQRTRELALLRAMGASRGQVIRSVLLEATVIGLVASVLGLAAGIGVGALLAWFFGTTGGTGLEIALAVPTSAVIAAFAVGLGVTWIAAMLPAVRASRIPPIAAMRDAATPDKPLTRLTIAGAVFFAVGGGLLAWGLFGDGGGDAALWSLLGGVIITFIGVALLTPIISRPVVSVLGRLFSWSVPGQLGRRNSARNPRRTAITAAALMVSIALVTGVSTILASLTQSISEQVDSTLAAELVISGQQTSVIPPTFDAAALPKMKEIDGVEDVAGFYFDAAKIDGEQGFLVALSDPAATQRILGMEAKSGTIDQVPANHVIIDENTAEERDLKVGDTIQVQLTRGPLATFTVGGVYAENEAVGGFLAAPETVSGFRVGQPTQGFVDVADGASVKDVEERVAALLADSPEVSVQDRSAFIESITSQFDQLLVMVQILLAMAILIAVLGIINTLALSVIERTRELGLLRAIGLRRSQAWRMITVESIVISLFGAALGVVVGVGLGAAVVKALEDEGFTSFGLPWGQMVTYLVLAGVVGVIAAVLPAIRAARLNVLGAIAYE